jgi:hypothetical protein
VTAPACRVCRSKSLRHHCDIDAKHCKWMVCRGCGSFGYLDGRWYSKPKNEVLK